MGRWRKSKTSKVKVETSMVVDSVPPNSTRSTTTSVSLGAGSFPAGGPVSFTPSPSRSVCTRSSASFSSLCATDSESVTPDASISGLNEAGPSPLRKKSLRDLLSSGSLREKILCPVTFQRPFSSFIRVADLQMTESSHSCANDKDEVHPNFHHAAVDPPPGVDRDPLEMWVALDDGAGSHAPIAPYAVEALAQFGFNSAMNQQMWVPDKKTERLVKTGKHDDWHSCVWQTHGLVQAPPRGFDEENEVMVWSGNFVHGLYGSDLPAVRAVGIVNMSALALFNLLIDSSRVKEYNQISLGRKDLLILNNNLEEDGPFGRSVTKVMQSESKPPLVRKVLQFVSILHARELEDGTGYLLVSRAVTQGNPGGFDANILRSEILMGVNVIRKVQDDENRCLMINVNHIRSPMIPMMIAKKLGLSAAANFLNDLRSLC